MLINGVELNIYEYEGKKIIGSSQVDKILKLNPYTFSNRVIQRIKTNKLIEQVDYITLEKEQIHNIKNYNKKNVSKTYFLYETGVKKCVLPTEDTSFIEKYFEEENKREENKEDTTKQTNIIENSSKENDKANEKVEVNKVSKKENKKKVNPKENATSKNDIKFEQINLDIIQNKDNPQKDNLQSEQIIENNNSSQVDNIIDSNNQSSNPNQIVDALSLVTQLMNNFMNMHMNMIQQQNNMIQQQNETNEKFREELKFMYEEMMDNTRTVLNMRKLDVSNRDEIKNVDTENYTFDSNDLIVIEENSDYSDWKRNINKAVDKILELKGNFKTRNEVMSTTYKELTKQYGIVWDQEKKGFYKEFGRGPVNTMELAWYVERLSKANKNLVISKLNTIYSEIRKSPDYIEIDR